MPTYEYVCRACGVPHEEIQAFTDDPLTVCPHCGGELRKVFGSVGIVFKGSGFYKTDSRSTSTASTAAGGSDTPASTTTSTGSDAPAPSGSSDATKPATTPATPAPAPSTPSAPSTPASTTSSASTPK